MSKEKDIPAIWCADVGESLRIAETCALLGQDAAHLGLEKAFRKWKYLRYAFLNRACELACAPIHIRPVETSRGLDYAWYTYRPIAGHLIEHHYLTDGTRFPVKTATSIPDAAVYLGLETDLTEDQARSKAMGY